MKFSNIPAAANLEKARVGLAEFKNEPALPQNVIEAVFGNSPYLSKLMLLEREFVSKVFSQSFEDSFEEIITRLKNYDITKPSQEELMQNLRILRRKASLLIALADITNSWNLVKVTNSLSDFANLAIRKTTEFLEHKYVQEGKISSIDGLIVLAVGKLGGRELNYSSDVDLIVLYDTDRTKYTGKGFEKEFFIRFTQSFVDILQKQTGDGYVFRVDLRLRPDPYSTPVAISVKSAEVYYENVGQNWERAAMIKARSIAGDEKAASKYLEFLGSYIWRKYLDFAAIEDIRSIKRQIDSRSDYNPDNFQNYNVKVGKGGIREIEFFAQVQQLIWGGREENLRSSVTCETLRELAKTKRISLKTKDELIEAYEFYRKTEHRLQMRNDEQSHTLPGNDKEFEDFAIFMGFKNSKEFTDKLTGYLHLVQKNYAELFGESTSLGMSGNLVFTGVSSDQETLVTLNKMGFKDPEKISETIRGWHHGRRRATRFKRVREILTELVPHILKAFAGSTNPDEAFLKFDAFLGQLPSGVQLFALFNEKPELIELIAEIMGNSPWLAENLSRSPALVNRILTSEFEGQIPARKQLRVELKDALKFGKDIDEKMKITRRWKHDMEFQVGIRLLKRTIPHDKAAIHLSDIAEVVVSRVLKLVRSKIDGEIAIIAMGKFGDRELTFGSDLDLVFIYDSANPEAANKFSKLVQKFTTAITTLSEDGALYNIDSRLRPMGEKGAVASSLASFEKYYNGAAWSWEFMALTKARVVAGDIELKTKLRKLLKSLLAKPYDAKKLATDMGDMRRKIAVSFPETNPWDIKYAQGGLFEAEFIMQYHKLTHTGLIRPGFDDACKFLSDMQSIIRLTCHDGFAPDTASESQKHIITEHFNEKNFEAVLKRLLDTENLVHKYYTEIFN